MANKGDGRIDDGLMQQLKRQRIDPNVTFIGRRETAGKLGDGTPDVIVWIARHSVLPDKPQVRSVTLIDDQAPGDLMVHTFVEAALPASEKNLAPIVPGQVEVSDPEVARLLQSALRPLDLQVAVTREDAAIDDFMEQLRQDLEQKLTPMPMWDTPIELKRELASASANVFRRDPWSVLGDVPLVAVEVRRYGVETLWISLVGNRDGQHGIFVFFSYDDFARYQRAVFATAKLEDADNDPDNLDLPDADIALVREFQASPDAMMGDAITIFYMDAAAVGPALLREMQDRKIPFAGRDAIPHFMRIAPNSPMRRPNDEEIRALRLGLDAFNYFFTRHHQEIVQELWHFAPISSVVQPKDGKERVPVRVTISSMAPTFDPAMTDRVLRLRVYIEDDPTIWREIEILAQQRLIDLDTAIRDAFSLPQDEEGLFLPKDIYDGDDTWETMLIEDFQTSDAAPIGLMLQQPRDFCHYFFGTDDHVDFFVRLRGFGEKDEAANYPQLVASHGDAPDLAFDMDDDEDEDEIGLDLEDDD